MTCMAYWPPTLNHHHQHHSYWQHCHTMRNQNSAGRGCWPAAKFFPCSVAGRRSTHIKRTLSRTTAFCGFRAKLSHFGFANRAAEFPACRRSAVCASLPNRCLHAYLRPCWLASVQCSMSIALWGAGGLHRGPGDDAVPVWPIENAVRYRQEIRQLLKTGDAWRITGAENIV